MKIDVLASMPMSDYFTEIYESLMAFDVAVVVRRHRHRSLLSD
jgi:hypothetical protein